MQRVALETQLARALGRGELLLHYQPKIALATGAVVGVEALVRWQHPDRGLVFPDEFIPLAERSGLITELTDFVLEAAAAQHAEWRTAGLVVPIAVNLSVDSLTDRSFPRRLARLCRGHGIAPAALELEVTETAVMAEPETALAVLEALATAGFPLAIDDFGTGFSSLAYLRTLPVSIVKIDKSFVAELPSREADARIVRGTIELVHGLGKQVVAEGVETVEALEFLRRVGCYIGQGYHWHRPMPGAGLASWIGQREGHSAASPAPGGGALTPGDEAARLAALHTYRILDTAYETIFDDIAAAAARSCDTPISAVTLVDAERQWFKAKLGLDVRETSRHASFCAHTILDAHQVLVVPDARADARFATNPFVTAHPNIRFYAGAPILTPAGYPIGSVCVLDTRPRHLSPHQTAALRLLAAQVLTLLELRRQVVELSDEGHVGVPPRQHARAG